MRTDAGSDTYQLVDAAFLAKVVDFAIEVGISHAALVDVAEYQCTLVAGATRHEVEGNIQRVDIAVVGVVNKLTTMLAFLHLQAHGDRFQLSHALSQLLWRNT